MKGNQTSIRLKPVKWEDHSNFSSTYIMGDRYEVRIIEGYGWCANHRVDNPFATLAAAKSACEQHALERIREAVEVVSDHIPDATKMVDSWQPISTAPRDGTVIFLATPYGDEEGHWDDDQGQWLSERIDSSHGYEVELHPTHWLILPPLPKPPKEGIND